MEHVEATTDERPAIHARRVEQMQRLGLPSVLADEFAKLVDWHQIAELVVGGYTLERAICRALMSVAEEPASV
jgi:hypothetical protein